MVLWGYSMIPFPQNQFLTGDLTLFGAGRQQHNQRQFMIVLEAVHYCSLIPSSSVAGYEGNVGQHPEAGH